jgi:hypothetical protein
MAGDFSAAQLYPVLDSINKMWADPRSNRDLYEPTEVVRAIAENQMVTLNEILVNNSCRGYEVGWLKRCGVSATDISGANASSSCELSGAEIDADSASYDTSGTLSDSFTVWDDDCKGLISYEEKVARGLMECQKNIEKKLNIAALGFLHANIQDNTHVVGNIDNQAGLGSYFQDADWNVDLIAQMAEVAIMNRIKDPIFVSGSNLWGVNFNAQYEFSNTDGKDRLLKMKHFKNWYWDLETVDVTLGTKSTVMFDKGAVAFFTKNEYTNLAPINSNDTYNTIYYTMPSMGLTYMNGGQSVPVRFDILSQAKCKTLAGGIKKWGRTFQVICQYGFIVSPEDCAGNTGIIEFIKGIPA